jgi:Pyridoxamine 5'-phosphate oxidase
MERSRLIGLIRASGLGVLASRGPDGAPQAALVGIAVTERAEIVFDTALRARKVGTSKRTLASP